VDGNTSATSTSNQVTGSYSLTETATTTGSINETGNQFGGSLHLQRANERYEER